MDLRLDGFSWLVLAGGLLLACALDLRSRRLPNWLTVSLFVGGVTAHGLQSGAFAAGWCALGALVGLILAVIPFRRGWLAGGDVKLFAAVGAWIGPRWVLEAALAVSIAGGVIALIYLLRAPADARRDMLRNLKLSAIEMTIVAGERRPHELSPPYAPAITVGAVWTVWAHAALFLQS